MTDKVTFDSAVTVSSGHRHSFVFDGPHGFCECGATARVVADATGAYPQPYLGLATTRQLINELAARCEVSEINGEAWPKYRTIDEPAAPQAASSPMRCESVYRAGIKAGLERAAKVCDSEVDAEYKTGKVDHNEQAWCQRCSAAIRVLKGGAK